MKLTSRKTHAFVVIKVDELETTVFGSSKKEIEDMISNLLDVAEDLASYTDMSLKDRFDPGGFL